MSEEIDVPVIIVGGGGCGLSLSVFLSNYGVDHILFERSLSASPLPKAHYLNQRTMEIFRCHGIESEIKKCGAPQRQMSYVGWATSLGGSEFLDRRIIHKFPCFGGDGTHPHAQAYINDAPERSANLPLCRLEPILCDHATAKHPKPDSIRFGHTVLDIVDDGETVVATVKDKSGKTRSYRSKYLVGADGGRFVGQKCGVVMNGRTAITDMVSVHFEADLSGYWDDRFFGCHFVNGSCDTMLESGALVPMGPTWGRHSEEWVFHFGFDLEDDSRFDEQMLIARIRELLKIDNLALSVRRISHWTIEGVVANKYREGNVFIAGDAAHRAPPTTGLGLNTGIEDALNLAWKLAFVLNYSLDEKLLDSYQLERQQVATVNRDWGLFTFENSAVINAALGLVAGQKDRNKLKLERLFEDTIYGRGLQAQLQKMIESQCIEFSAHAIELGFRYDNGFILSNETQPTPFDALGQHYQPTTNPGSRLPHAWLENVDGKVVSTHDLVGRDLALLLLTDEHGAPWLYAAKRAAAFHKVPITVAQIGSWDNRHILFKDRDDQWEKAKGITCGGAILVRPDNFVAWRAMEGSKRNGEELIEALAVLVSAAGPKRSRVNGASKCHHVDLGNGVNGIEYD